MNVPPVMFSSAPLRIWKLPFEVSVPAVLTIPSKMRALFPGMVRRGVAGYAKDALPKP